MRCSIASTFWRHVSHSILTGALNSRFMVRPPCWDGPSPSPGHWLCLTLMLDLTHFLLFPPHWPSFDRATLPVASGGTVFERLLSWEFTCLKLPLFHAYASLIVWAYDSRLKCIFPRIQKPSVSNFQCYRWVVWCYSDSQSFVWNLFFPSESFRDLFPVLSVLKFHEDESWHRSNFINCARYLMGPIVLETHILQSQEMFSTFFKDSLGDFPGGPEVKNLRFHCRGHGFDPC